MVSTIAKQGNPNNPLDTVIEITNENGAGFTTGCNQPGGTTTDFTSPCLNDDVSARRTSRTRNSPTKCQAPRAHRLFWCTSSIGAVTLVPT